MLFVLSSLASLVFWSQLGSLAQYGQWLLWFVTVLLASTLAVVLSRAWFSQQLMATLVAASGPAGPSLPPGASLGRLSHTLASEFDRLQRENQLLLQAYDSERHRLLNIEGCLNGFVTEFLVDATGRLDVKNVDQSIERFFRFTRDDFLRNWQVLLEQVDPVHHVMLRAMFGRAEAFPNKESGLFSTLAQFGVAKQHFQVTLQREAKPQGVYVHAVFLEVSDLVRAKEEAESADRAKAEFLATISHELRTPLNAIIGFAKLLGEQLEEGAQKTDLGNISSAANSLHVILSDVLEYSRIQANGLKLERERFDLCELITQVHGLNANLAKAKQLDYSLLIEPDRQPLFVLGDVNRLRQIIQNLLSNAIKFTNEGYVRARIIKSEPARGRVEVFIEVADSGIGMKPDQLARIFTRFTQADRSINRQFGGTGLGLAICKGLVELMGGRIDVASEFEIGSVFTISLNLPVAPASMPATKAAEKAGGAEIKPLDILVVDDHPMNIKLLDRYLGKRGHRVDQATGGVAAVEMCQAKRYDLVLMDIDMPDVDGHEATRRIRADLSAASCGSTICALSGLSDDQNIAASIQAGMNMHLTKPVAFDKLDALILDLCTTPAQ